MTNRTRTTVSITLFVLVGLITSALYARHAPSAFSPQDRFPDAANARSPELLPVATAASVASTPANGNYAVPINFEPNQGQTDPQVRFLARGKGYRLFLTATDAIVSLHAARGDRRPLLLRIQPIGANPAPRLVAESALLGKVNYVRGADPKTSITSIPTYGRVRYQDVYPDVDLVYHGDGRQLEYDFVVGAGADPEQIQLRFKGATKLTVNAAGELVLHTAAGELAQPKPVVYQEIDGVRRTIAGSYLLKGSDQVGFRLGDYDRSRPLTIDPLLAYSTYFGGDGEEMGWDVAVDAAGNAHIVGVRPSVRYHDSVDDDVFVAKFDAAGALLWLTDVGENCDDEGRGIALDSSGNVYITGTLGP